MRPDERLEHVRLLRERGQTPKQIARTLGIRSAEAGRLVRAAAVLAQAEAPEPRMVGCWVSPTWSTGLTVGEHSGWPLHEDREAGTDGLVSVLVAREHRYDKVSVCGYLADVYCLGVKNALGPDIMDEFGLRRFNRDFFSGYHEDPIEAPIELAREVVFGSIEYARGLGFEPPPDVANAEGHLGAWTGPSTITFGKNGKPFYISGPRDDPRTIIRTLERTIGRGNFDSLLVAG
ncbi:MAG: helix-turn-helix domain-containing protein [Sciscionella sp.]